MPSPGPVTSDTVFERSPSDPVETDRCLYGGPADGLVADADALDPCRDYYARDGRTKIAYRPSPYRFPYRVGNVIKSVRVIRYIHRSEDPRDYELRVASELTLGAYAALLLTWHQVYSPHSTPHLAMPSTDAFVGTTVRLDEDDPRSQGAVVQEEEDRVYVEGALLDGEYFEGWVDKDDVFGGATITQTGTLGMQVCVPDRWDDERVLAFANRKNPCGTETGWHIRRDGDEALQGDPERQPCAEREGYVHIMLDA